MKFLSVLCTIASTLPRLHAAVTAAVRLRACTPYALLMMCGTPSLLQSLATAMTSSLALQGAATCNATEHSKAGRQAGSSRWL
jgi:hypothetical protein